MKAITIIRLTMTISLRHSVNPPLTYFVVSYTAHGNTTWIPDLESPSPYVYVLPASESYPRNLETLEPCHLRAKRKIYMAPNSMNSLQKPR